MHIMWGPRFQWLTVSATFGVEAVGNRKVFDGAIKGQSAIRVLMPNIERIWKNSFHKILMVNLSSPLLFCDSTIVELQKLKLTLWFFVASMSSTLAAECCTRSFPRSMRSTPKRCSTGRGELSESWDTANMETQIRDIKTRHHEIKWDTMKSPVMKSTEIWCIYICMYIHIYIYIYT